MANNGPRVPNDALLAGGLSLMQQNSKPLRKIDGPGRSMLYALANGERVRVRTCNDHVLVVLANDPEPEKATLNIEGTEHLLIVMPEIQRTHGRVIAYFVPSEVAAKEAKQAHAAWLKTNPNTNGDNRTWNLWFEGTGPWSGFAQKWHNYRLQGQATTSPDPLSSQVSATLTIPSTNGGIKAEVEAARQRIAAAAGVSPAAVRITVDFGL